MLCIPITTVLNSEAKRVNYFCHLRVHDRHETFKILITKKLCILPKLTLNKLKPLHVDRNDTIISLSECPNEPLVINCAIV